MQSWSYVLFVVIGVLLYWAVIPRRFRPHYLLAISIGYYFSCSIAFALFLLIYLYGMFVVGILIDTSATKKGRLTWAVIGISVAIGILVLFKARASIVQLVFLIMGMGGGKLAAAVVTRVGIPVGISYFTFRAVHYLIEVYRGKVIRATPLEFFLYVTFFPAMVSGPINRFYTIGREDPRDSFGDQVRQEGGSPAFNVDDISYGIWRTLQGVVKKFVIADFFYKLAGPMMTQQGLSPTVDTWQMWIAGHAWYLYLYIDFSGYTDMAIGIARMFGYRLMENFNWPILATNLRDFWRRWHMSLTYYVTQYVYIPLGGSHKGKFRTDVNILITIIVIAAWHGVGLNFIVWGIIQGVGLVVYRRYSLLKRRLLPNHKPTWWGKVISIILMFHWFDMWWPLFHHGFKVSMIYYLKMFPFLTHFFPVLGKLIGLGG